MKTIYKYTGYVIEYRERDNFNVQATKYNKESERGRERGKNVKKEKEEKENNPEKNKHRILLKEQQKNIEEKREGERESPKSARAQKANLEAPNISYLFRQNESLSLSLPAISSILSFSHSFSLGRRVSPSLA